jgi:hypothetical protein
MYQTMISGRKARVGGGAVVSSRTAMTTATRTVMTRKRTRPSQGSHSFVLGMFSVIVTLVRSSERPRERFLLAQRGSEAVCFASLMAAP